MTPARFMAASTEANLRSIQVTDFDGMDVDVVHPWEQAGMA